MGLQGEALKIRLTAVPVDGKANHDLVAFLAAQLSISRTQIQLVSGVSSRHKRLRVQLSEPVIPQVLAGLVNSPRGPGGLIGSRESC